MYTTKSFFDKTRISSLKKNINPILNAITTSWGNELSNTSTQLVSLVTSNLDDNSEGNLIFKKANNEILFTKNLKIIENVGTIEILGNELSLFENDTSYKISASAINLSNGKKTNTLTITFKTTDTYKSNIPQILNVWTSFGDVLKSNKNDFKIKAKIINVLEEQVGTVKIVHDKIIDFIFKNSLENGILVINFPKDLILSLKKDITYKIIVDINNEYGYFAETNDSKTFTVDIPIEVEVIKKNMIVNYQLQETEINFYLKLLDKIDLLVYRSLIGGNPSNIDMPEASYVSQDITIRYDIVVYSKRYKVENLEDMLIDKLHEIQVEIYGIELEYKRYKEFYGDVEVEDMEINKLRLIEKDLYKNTIDRVIYYQTHKVKYEDEKDINKLSVIHISLYGDNLEYIIYKELYGSSEIDEEKLNDIINEIFE